MLVHQDPGQLLELRVVMEMADAEPRDRVDHLAGLRVTAFGVVKGSLESEVDQQGTGSDQGERPRAPPESGASRPTFRPARHADAPGLDRPSIEEAPQVVGHIEGGGIPAGGLLLEAFQTDRLEVAITHGIDAPRGGWRLFEDKDMELDQ